MISLNPEKLQSEVAQVSSRIKAEPLKASHRVALANLRLLQGEYPKALQQLQVACQADLEWAPQAQLVKMLVQCEALRTAVFAGKIQPDLFASAPQWLELLLQVRGAQGDEAANLQRQAMELAPETPGVLNKETPFEWFADGDERLGPSLEVFIGGSYYWLPVEQVDSIDFRPQGHVLDLLWMPVSIKLAHGQMPERIAYIPVRYPAVAGEVPNTEFETEWVQAPDSGVWQGRGQRVWYIDGEAMAIGDVSSLVFRLPEAAQ